MTVETTSTYAGPYPLNGVATAFPFSFKALSASEVRVEVAGVAIDPAQYRVQLASQGGTVIFTSPPTGGDLYVISAPDFRQVISFSNQSAFLPASHNEANDRGAVRDQVLAEGLGRAFQVPFGEAPPPIPVRSQRDGKFAGWMDGGLAAVDLDAGLIGANPIVVSSRFVMGLLGAASFGQPATLTEVGREGTFVWRTGDYSARVAIDTAQGIYVASTTIPTTTGCWVRVAAGPMFTSWFGVVHDAGSGDAVAAGASENGPAVRAAFKAASAFKRPLLASPGGFMFDTTEVGPFTVFDAGGKQRGSTIYQSPASTVPLFTLAAGPVPDCSFKRMIINCNAKAGTDCFFFDATGAVNGSGGLWYGDFESIRINNCGGKGLALWTGSVAGDYVHQFLSLRDVVIYRTADNAVSRCLSFAGRVAQVYINGACEFDGNGIPGVKREGVNVVLGRRWPEGDFYSHQISGAATTALSSGPAVVSLEATIQGLRGGILVDACTALALHDIWFESIERAITVYNGSQVKVYNCRFANAASDRITDGNNLGVGWGVAKDAGSVVTVEACEFYGLVDSALGGGGTFRTIDGFDAGNWLIFANNIVPGWSGFTKGVTRTVASTGGVLRLLGVREDFALLPAGTDANPVVVTAVELNLQPGRSLRLLATGPFRYSYNGNNNLDVAGKSFRLREGDILDIFASDTGTAFRGTITRRRLSFSAAPAANQLDDAEFAWNDAPAVASGKILLGWVKIPGGGIQPFYGTNT